MKNQEKNKSVRNTILVIIAIVLIAAITIGGTYAWWRWQSSSEQATDVTITISKPGFTIVADNASSSTLMPTAACYNTPATNHVQHTLAGKATVTAQNNTTTTMRAVITLKAMLSSAVTGSAEDETGATTARLSHVHWAIKKVDSASDAFSSANCTGTAGTQYATGTFDNPSIGTSYTDIPTSITFDVNPGDTATNYYQVYVWIDSDYKHTNEGSTQSDPLQNNTITITFSENSTFSQDMSIS